MAKFKMLAVVALAAGALFVAPAAASAYVPDESVTVVGTPTPGAAVEVVFEESFLAGESVSFAVTGEGRATLAVAMAVETVTLVKQSDSAGSVSVDVTLPANATGTYTTTATGLTSGTVGTAALTVVAADGGAGAGGGGTGSGSDDELAFTGADSTTLLLWAGSGALLLGVAFIVVMTTVRRQRANASN